jgi:hypothetical protein
VIGMENNQNSRLIEKRVKRERRKKLGKEGKRGEIRHEGDHIRSIFSSQGNLPNTIKN